MAKKASKKSSSARKRRKRRSSEEIIADLQEEIRRVRARQKARELKSSPGHKAALGAIRAIDKALEAATQEGDSVLRHVLADTRKGLGAYLEKKGIELPRIQLPKGPKPREMRELEDG